MNKPDEIVIKNGIIYILREVETLPDFSNNYRIITALKIEEVKKAIEQMDEVEE